MKHRGSLDRNHHDRAGDFEALGCTVAHTAWAGVPGFPDLVVGCVGVNHLVEIKNPDTAYGRRGLNADQTAFNRDWRGAPMVQVSTTEQVATLVQGWRAAVVSPP